ncbi:MAG: succinate dehydrogenase assembly factor 2 [Betaproteobacteria bacterium]|nr:succinate dehydrogenase assembly factor 2 [Betaproteobacteria bacterium]
MDAAQARRLSWRCRRGMLELDLLLSALAVRLAAGESVAGAEELLECDDNQLWDVLVTGRVQPAAQFASLAARLRQQAHSIPDNSKDDRK